MEENEINLNSDQQRFLVILCEIIICCIKPDTAIKHEEIAATQTLILELFSHQFVRNYVRKNMLNLLFHKCDMVEKTKQIQNYITSDVDKLVFMHFVFNLVTHHTNAALKKVAIELGFSDEEFEYIETIFKKSEHNVEKAQSLIAELPGSTPALSSRYQALFDQYYTPGKTNFGLEMNHLITEKLDQLSHQETVVRQ